MFYLLFFAVFSLLVVLVIKFIQVYTTKITEIVIGSKHEDAEQIMSDGMVPPKWTPANLPTRSEWSRSRAKRRAVRRIDTIIRYFTHSPFVADEESRGILIKRLRYIRDDWQAKSPSELFPD